MLLMYAEAGSQSEPWPGLKGSSSWSPPPLIYNTIPPDLVTTTTYSPPILQKDLVTLISTNRPQITKERPQTVDQKPQHWIEGELKLVTTTTYPTQFHQIWSLLCTTYPALDTRSPKKTRIHQKHCTRRRGELLKTRKSQI